MYAKTGYVFRIEAAVAGEHETPMISIWRAERRTASAQRGDGGVDAVSPGPRPGAGWWRVGLIGLGLAIPVVSPAQVQYRDRNGQTWTAPNQIERQIREDINARSGSYGSRGPSLAELERSTELEVNQYKRRLQEDEDYTRRMHEQNNRRNEELKREMAWQAQAAALRDNARREAKQKEDREAHLAKERRIVAEILKKADEGPGVLKGSTWSPWLVAALGEGMITGKFHGLSLAEVGGVYGSVRERFGMAQRLFREADGFEGRAQNRNHEGRDGADQFDFISRAASVLRGSRNFVDRGAVHLAFASDIFSDWQEILVHLIMTLALPESGLNPAQREQAARLVADAMGRVSLEGDDGAAFACIVVTAARRSPELRRIPMLHEKVIPVARRSIWAYGIESWPSPEKEAVPLVVNPTTGLYWNLAAMLCLGSNDETPLQWFATLRDQRRAGLAPATATDLARVQQGLEGWFARRQFSAAVRQAIQADCDLACRGSEGELASATTWDATLRPFRGELHSYKEDAAVCAALSNPASLRQAGARSYFAISPLKSSPRTDAAIDGLVYTYLGKACAKGPDHATRVLTALRWVTDLDDAVSFRGIPRETWETLVKLGEKFCSVRDPQWTDPSVNARLARVRRERLGDEAGARQWLAVPGRQPNDGDTPEKWREWATMAGRPGLVVAASRHPEHWTEPALLRRALNAIAGNVVDVLSPTARPAVKALLARTESVTDPETVLVMAQLRGPILGDWARLGAWLDDPRRRPRGPDDPLYPVFFKAIIERDQAAGYLSENWFTSAKNAVACARLEKWLEQVLAAKGEVRKKLIDENFPAVIYCEDAASAYPDLRMLGYDAARGGFASRALLLLSTVEFNPETLLMAAGSEITLDDGTVLRSSLYDVEPWLEAVAKLPRSVPADVLLAQLTAGVQARLDWQAKLDALPRREVFPGLSKEENRELGAAESPAYQALVEDGRRSGWVGGGCQQALARLAERWSPVRESAQAAILARGDQLLLDQNDQLVHAPSIAARVKWEQCKMRGMDDAEAFAVASAGLSAKELRILASMASDGGWLHPLVLWQDEGFVAEARAAASAVAAR